MYLYVHVCMPWIADRITTWRLRRQYLWRFGESYSKDSMVGFRKGKVRNMGKCENKVLTSLVREARADQINISSTGKYCDN